MPLIRELTEAIAALDAAEKAEPVRTLTERSKRLGEKVSRLMSQIREIDAEIATHLADLNRAVEAAAVKQGVSLARWVQDGRSWHRFLLHTEGATNRVWDGRAWLRQMCHNDNQWHWTLDYHSGSREVGNSRVRIDTLIPITADTTIEEIRAAADTLLVLAGFHLTDLDNEPLPQETACR